MANQINQTEYALLPLENLFDKILDGMPVVDKGRVLTGIIHGTLMVASGRNLKEISEFCEQRMRELVNRK